MVKAGRSKRIPICGFCWAKGMRKKLQEVAPGQWKCDVCKSIISPDGHPDKELSSA